MFFSDTSIELCKLGPLLDHEFQVYYCKQIFKPQTFNNVNRIDSWNNFNFDIDFI